MAGSFTLPTVLANLTAGNEPLSLIDGDFTALYTPSVSLNTYSNFYTDIGAANAYVITVSSPQVVAQSAGLQVSFIAAHANTGASTLQINALAAKNITNPDGTTLAANQIIVNSIVTVIYDGTSYQIQSVSSQPAFTKGYLYGGIMSNGTDATNDIDITAGQAKDSTGAADLTWSALTKQLDAAWAVGTNAGGRDTGAIANGTWHVFAIKKVTDGTGDILYSLSATAPTMPSGYTFFRRIGSILRETGSIVAFKQSGDWFWRAIVTNYSSTAARAIALLTLSIPTGIEIQPLVATAFQQTAGAGDTLITLAPAANSAFSYDISSTNLASHRDNVDVVGPASNTSAQIYFAVTISSGALASGLLNTHGWIDRRGRYVTP